MKAVAFEGLLLGAVEGVTSMVQLFITHLLIINGRWNEILLLIQTDLTPETLAARKVRLVATFQLQRIAIRATRSHLHFELFVFIDEGARYVLDRIRAFVLKWRFAVGFVGWRRFGEELVLTL